MSRSKSIGRKTGCGVSGAGCVVVFLLAVAVGPVCFDYCLMSLLGIDIPWYGDLICGIIASEVVFPLAIILFVLHAFGVGFPLFPN